MAIDHEQTSKGRALLLSFSIAFFVVAIGTVLTYIGTHQTLQWVATKAAPLTSVHTPTHLVIPAIGVDANVQEVGIAPSGRMGVPTNFTDVAWYKLGPKPGEGGSAVIDGHLDTAQDANAVFARLGELKMGDEIRVTDATGQVLSFRVTDKEIYDDATAPLKKIFDATSAPRLNLITCDGAWDQKTKNYDKRLVVYSELTN